MGKSIDADRRAGKKGVPFCTPFVPLSHPFWAFLGPECTPNAPLLLPLFGGWPSRKVLVVHEMPDEEEGPLAKTSSLALKAFHIRLLSSWQGHMVRLHR